MLPPPLPDAAPAVQAALEAIGVTDTERAAAFLRYVQELLDLALDAL